MCYYTSYSISIDSRVTGIGKPFARVEITCKSIEN